MENLKRMKAGKAYLVCFNENCPRHETCLRWIAGRDTDEDRAVVSCINPRWRDVAKGTCNRYRNATQVTMPVGMRHFYDDMPLKTAKAIRPRLEEECKHTRYYLYQNGTLPIPPNAEAAIRRICHEHGWDGPLTFDGSVTSYLW